MQKLVLLYFFILFSVQISAQANGKARFEENKQQYPNQVIAKAEVPGGVLFVENQGFTWNFQTSDHLGHSHGEIPNSEPYTIRGHAVQMQLVGSSKNPTKNLEHAYPDYTNYFTSKDVKKWTGNVYSYKKVTVNKVYPGIDWVIYSTEKGLKYDFELAAKADPSAIQMQFRGAEDVFIKNGELQVKTSIGTLVEEAPIAHQFIDGVQKIIECKFKYSNGILSFDLGKYNADYPLTIDPILSFGSFSGSTADNWGFTSTYDYAGNTYSAGVVFGIGYPASPGAYQTTYAGGVGTRPGDIGIIKFDVNGQRLFATYLGGSNNELPQSLIVSNNNELFLFGTTGSSDFPTTSTAFSRTFAGGTQASILRGGITFPNGTDMFVARFAENGNQLLASTFIGGTENDGLNTASQLKYNYADEARGGILIDDQNNVYIGCSTSSADFPVPGNAFQSTYGGGTQDGIVLKMNANLSNLFWASFIGGTAADGIMNLTLDKQGNIFVAGGTSSLDFPVRAGAYQSANAGGQSDGFISGITSNGQSLFSSTYYGTDTYDQIFLVATSRANGIYVYGQTEKGGTTYQNNFAFSEPNGKQFISHFDHNLNSRVWSTSFGNGLAKPDITPSAFTVDICGQIFVCGWGGASNSSPNGGAFGGTSGLTTTPDAFQSTTDNNDFYLMVLNEQNQNLVYATFFGGPTSSEHVDGGTSRFDRRGVVHQAVCAGCGGRDDFPTTAGVWSNINGSSSGCNNAVFKFDFQLPATVASFTGPPIGCAPFEANFNNTSSYAEGYSWEVNGTEVTQNSNATYTFSNPGVYTIQLIANNPNSCNVRDTFTRQIRIVNSTRDVFDSLSVCYLTETQIGVPFPVDPYYQVSWSPEAGLDEPTSQKPFAQPEISTNYVLHLSLGSCADTIEQFIQLRLDNVDAGLDLDICRGQTVQIGNPGDSINYQYRWTPETLLDKPNSANPNASVDATTMFHLLRIPRDTSLGCPGKDSLQLFIPEGSPLAKFETEELATCIDVKLKITNTSEFADSYRWDFGNGTSTNANSLNPDVIYAYGDSVLITLYVENAVCRDTLTYLHDLKPLSDYFSINTSNAFSPNGDGKNDCFSPALQDLPAPDDKNFLACTTLHIFDRWGKQQFESVESDNGCWDGKNQAGEDCPDGTYFFIFKGQGQELQGNVTLLR